jgi:integrase
MSVRKRTWNTAKGEPREAWIVDYADITGRRHIRGFNLRKDAIAYEAKVRVDIKTGVHVAPSLSPTVQQAAEHRLKGGAHLEKATLKTYREHVVLHIVPFLGSGEAG